MGASLEQLARLTEDLIRFRSTDGRPEVLNACADYLAHLFDGTGLRIERFSFQGVPSLVVTKDTKTPRVFLSGHFDVVEGDDHQFDPRREGDRIVGRGALDMKSGIAAMATLMRESAKTSHDVGLMLTGDEEMGGFHGTKRVLEAGYGCQVAVIPDGGEAVHRVVAKAKGIIQVVIQAAGHNAHGSRPWTGKNAIDLLTEALRRAHAQFVPLEAHPQDHWVTTLNVGRVVGGDAINQVPGFAYAFCDVRYTEADSEDAVVSRLRAAMPEGVTVEARMSGPLVNVSLEHPLVAPFVATVREEGREPVMGVDHGATDGRFFTGRGIPVIISQPDGAGLHGTDEWVSIPGIGAYYRVLKGYLDRVAL